MPYHTKYLKERSESTGYIHLYHKHKYTKKCYNLNKKENLIWG